MQERRALFCNPRHPRILALEARLCNWTPQFCHQEQQQRSTVSRTIFFCSGMKLFGVNGALPSSCHYISMLRRPSKDARHTHGQVCSAPAGHAVGTHNYSSASNSQYVANGAVANFFLQNGTNVVGKLFFVKNADGSLTPTFTRNDAQVFATPKQLLPHCNSSVVLSCTVNLSTCYKKHTASLKLMGPMIRSCMHNVMSSFLVCIKRSLSAPWTRVGDTSTIL